MFFPMESDTRMFILPVAATKSKVADEGHLAEKFQLSHTIQAACTSAPQFPPPEWR